MDFGYLTGNHAEGILPGDLARELEDRGYASIWVPEHSHIPTSRRSPYPNGGQLPGTYFHMMDPMTSLVAAAATTTTLKLCTGICLVLEHDVLDLACTVATTDVLSQGRVVLGIGCGWNEEELENHRPDLEFRHRYSAMRERVDALRTAWRDETASYDGRWDRYTESWVYPKPVSGTVPIALGNAGPLGIKHAAEYADEWCPIDVGVMNVDGSSPPRRAATPTTSPSACSCGAGPGWTASRGTRRPGCHSSSSHRSTSTYRAPTTPSAISTSSRPCCPPSTAEPPSATRRTFALAPAEPR
jgi:probable F420-dependent oxidoreductase